MSQRSSSSNASRAPSFGMSSYSINRSTGKSGPLTRFDKTNRKEELIAKKITEIFKDKELRMIRTIEQTIYDDNLKIFKMKRSEFDEELTEIEKERVRIIKRKKNKKERQKALRYNVRQQLYYLVRALNETVRHYKTQYLENDNYRMQRLLKISRVEKTKTAKMKTTQEVLNNLFHSPFKDDRRFMIAHLAIETRDRLNDSRHLVDQLFFDKIFKLMLNAKDEQNTLQSYEIVCNLLKDVTYRAKLRDQNYIRQIFQAIDLEKVQERMLEKVSHLITLIAFHSDLLPVIIKTQLLNSFIIKMMNPKYSVTIRSNAIIAIALLSYHEALFKDLIKDNVIDVIIELCTDPLTDLSIKRYSTLALVHFALNRQSLEILLDKGVMDLVNVLSCIDNEYIQTNMAWVFLALCNNGITGKQMLMNGITRDMFIISYNPQFEIIRHLVIAGYAELGRADNLQEHSVRPLPRILQRIKEKAIVGTQSAYAKEDAANTIDVLLKFTLSSESQFKLTAFWALKDYLLLNKDDGLVEDLRGIIQAFVNGAAEPSDKVKAECATAISFLITHHLVFTEATAEANPHSEDGARDHEFKEDYCYILDALMYLTGQESIEVRARAFSTLSSLSTYASQTKRVTAQIQHDIKLPPGEQSKNYYALIESRLFQSKRAFRAKYETENIEKVYAGLYCLLRLAQEPDEAGTEEAARLLRQFYFPERSFKILDTKGDQPGPATTLLESDGNLAEQLTDEEKRHLSVNIFSDELDERELDLDELNEKFFIYVFSALLYTQNRRILYQLLDVINFYIKHETPHQKEVINPNIILWMLKIIDTHKDDEDLCLLAAKTVLKVVNNHQIVFDYQEMAIIKKFNKALDNIGDPNGDASDDSDTEASVRHNDTDQKKHNEGLQEEIKTLSEDQIRKSLDEPKTATFKPTEKPMNETPELDQVLQTLPLLPFIDKLYSTDPMGEAWADAAEANEILQEAKNSQDTNQSSDSQDFLTEIENLSQAKEDSVRALSALQAITPRPRQSIMIIEEDARKELQQQLKQQSEQSVRSDKMSCKSPTRRIFGVSKANLIVDFRGIVTLDKNFKIEQIDRKQGELRDTIIKSFMVIFTNEKSQHLLLNKDIIEIAFSCLENVYMVSTEAKHNLARLLSIIFKFPQVQDRLSSERIILGLVYLLQGSEVQNEQILQYLVTACSYISLNFNFVNSTLSLRILQALVPILFKLLANPAVDKSPQNSTSAIVETLGRNSTGISASSAQANPLDYRLSAHILTPIDKRSERENCVYAISNLLKGHPQNVQFFTECNASRILMIEIMRIQDSSNKSRELSELLSSCIKEIAYKKQTFRQFLQFGEENINLLPACLQKCFAISDSWHTCTSELILFEKLFVDGEKHYEGENEMQREERLAKEQIMRKLDSTQILNIDYKNIEKIQMLEKLEEREDKSFSMAPLCKLRCHCYSIAASCMLNGFNQQFLFEECKLLSRVIEDLQMNDKNDFVFQSLLEILRTIKKDPAAIYTLFQNYGKQLIALIRTMKNNAPKRGALFTTLVYLMLKAPEELLQVSQEILSEIFALASQIDDDGIKENVLWLQAALIEVNTSDQQHNRAIELCTEFQSAQVFLDNLKSANEIIVLQAIKGLKTMAATPEFKSTMLVDIGDELFMTLANILAQRLSEFQQCGLEIEVELVAFLAYITESDSESNEPQPLAVAAKRRAVQQGFMEHYLRRISSLKYIVIQDMDILNENCDTIANLDLAQLNGADMDPSELLKSRSEQLGLDSVDIRILSDGGDFEKCQVLDYYPSYESEPDTNRLVEYTIQLAANVTEMAETHNDLVNGVGQILLQTTGLLDSIVRQCIEVESEQVDLINYSMGNKDICNALSQIVLNLCLSTTQLTPGAPIVQDQCVAAGIGTLMVHVCRSLVDYELHANLYRSMCLLAASPNQETLVHFVESECLNEVQQAAENSRFFRVRRTCTKGLDQFTPELFDMNEKMMRRRRKATKRVKGKSVFNKQATNSTIMQQENMVNIAQ